MKSLQADPRFPDLWPIDYLSLIHISEPTRLLSISYAVFCLKKKNKLEKKEKKYISITTMETNVTTDEQ